MQKDLFFPEVCQFWKCPVCRTTLLLKIEIGNHYYSCSILTPPDLKIGDQVTLDNAFVLTILAIQIDDENYRIALKDYRAITLGVKDQIAVINGSWLIKRPIELFI